MIVDHRPAATDVFGEIPTIDPSKYPIQELATILSDYNGREVTPFSRAVVTGQQLGYMGGPALTIIKAISCIVKARELDAQPIFWLATEDHDIGEIDHTYWIDELGNVKKYHLSLPKEGFFVEDLELTEDNQKSLRNFLAVMGQSDLFVPSKSYVAVMKQLLQRLFQGTELLFVEPRLLRHLAAPFFEHELQGERNLFYKNEKGHRKKIEECEDASSIPVDRLSCNVSARPVMQSFVIPTVTYVAGPNEMNYYRELQELHAFHSVPMPELSPRLSLTFVDALHGRLMQQLSLSPWEKIPQKWEALFPEMEKMNKQEKHAYTKERGIPHDALHRLHNWFNPKERPQERVLNWFGFQSLTDENLVKALIDEGKSSGEMVCTL